MSDSRQSTAPASTEHHEEHEDHGNSVAAWTGVVVMMIGSLVMSIAVAMTSLWIFVAGSVVVAIGAAAWKVLSSMGYGAGTR